MVLTKFKLYKKNDYKQNKKIKKCVYTIIVRKELYRFISKNSKLVLESAESFLSQLYK